MNKARVRNIIIDAIDHGKAYYDEEHYPRSLWLDGYDNYVDILVDEVADAAEHGVELCTVECSFTKPVTLDHMQEYLCSRCGEHFFHQVLGEDDKPRHCTHCGAKVVEHGR